jgi:hypothetical protein
MIHGHAYEEDLLLCCEIAHGQQRTHQAHYGPWRYQTFLHELTRQHLPGCESFSSFLMFPTHPNFCLLKTTPSCNIAQTYRSRPFKQHVDSPVQVVVAVV